MVGVATEILINFRISDGRPLCHPEGNGQNKMQPASSFSVQPPPTHPLAYLGVGRQGRRGEKPCQWGRCLNGGWQRHYQALQGDSRASSGLNLLLLSGPGPKEK